MVPEEYSPIGAEDVVEGMEGVSAEAERRLVALHPHSGGRV